MPTRCASWRRGRWRGRWPYRATASGLRPGPDDDGRLFRDPHQDTGRDAASELKEVQSGSVRQPDGSRILDLFEQQKTLRLLDTVSKGRAASGQRCDAHQELSLRAWMARSRMSCRRSRTICSATSISSSRSLASCPSPPPESSARLAIHPNPAKKLAWFADGTRVLFRHHDPQRTAGP